MAATRTIRLLDELVGTPHSLNEHAARNGGHLGVRFVAERREPPSPLPTSLCGGCAALADVYRSGYISICKGDPWQDTMR